MTKARELAVSNLRHVAITWAKSAPPNELLALVGKIINGGHSVSGRDGLNVEQAAQIRARLSKHQPGSKLYEREKKKIFREFKATPRQIGAVMSKRKKKTATVSR